MFSKPQSICGTNSHSSHQYVSLFASLQERTRTDFSRNSGRSSPKLPPQTPAPAKQNRNPTIASPSKATAPSASWNFPRNPRRSSTAEPRAATTCTRPALSSGPHQPRRTRMAFGASTVVRHGRKRPRRSISRRRWSGVRCRTRVISMLPRVLGCRVCEVSLRYECLVSRYMDC